MKAGGNLDNIHLFGLLSWLQQPGFSVCHHNVYSDENTDNCFTLFWCLPVTSSHDEAVFIFCFALENLLHCLCWICCFCIISATLLSYGDTECMMSLTFDWYFIISICNSIRQLRLLALRLHTDWNRGADVCLGREDFLLKLFFLMFLFFNKCDINTHYYLPPGSELISEYLSRVYYSMHTCKQLLKYIKICLF